MPAMPSDPGAALSFGQAAASYDAIRPHYPAEALTWALSAFGERPLRVVDLGAGTGILTRLLVELGHDVTAVDPDPQMLEALRRRTPGIAGVMTGAAEDIPLPDASADVITAGQAYHWFDTARAHPELARVLRPGGAFVPVWNVRDESVPWVARMSELIGVSKGERVAGTLVEADFGPSFGTPEAHEVRFTRVFTEDLLVDLVRSRSYYLSGDDAHKALLESRVRDLARTHPDLAGRETFDLPYVTEVYRVPRLR